MPQLFWSLLAAPRFKIGERICGQYKIHTIVDEDISSQLVHAKSKKDNTQKVLRIITRARVSETDMTDEIEWLKTTCSVRDQFVKYLDYHTDMRHFYIVFDKRPRTLKDVVAETGIHLSRRHIVEMTLQILHATRHLNNHSIYDIDICPENFEVVDENIAERYYNNEAGSFMSRDVLKSSQIRFGYYGKLGKALTATMSERYRSPEHVYDMAINPASNIFSIGCIIAELLLRKPLFPLCLSGPRYTQEKSVLYDTILGPFPDAMIHDIRRSFKGVFKYENSDFPEYQGVSTTIQEFCERAEPLKYLILEEYANDLVECMTHLDYTRRVPLGDLLHHPFFDVSAQ